MRHGSVLACRQWFSIVYVGGGVHGGGVPQKMTPHESLKMETPFKMLHGEITDLSHLRVIGARAFVYINDSRKARRRGLGREGVRL